jgi:Bacterial SH3 domain
VSTTLARHGLAVALLTALVTATLSTSARADDDEALVRVIAEEAGVHTGPGFGYRVVYVAKRDEVLPAIGRATNDHWFRVQLPDGTYGWILGDEVFPLDVDTSEAHRGPSIFKRMGDAMFSPSPLLEGGIGFTFSAGLLGGDGMFMFRPSALLSPHLALEGFVGETVGKQADVIYAGGGFNSNLFPSSPVTPFLAAAAGGAFGRKKADQFTIKTGNYTALNVGGGLLVALKKRLTVRGEVRHYVIFDANHTQRIEEYSGALCVYF